MDLGDIRSAIESWLALATGLPVYQKERSQSYGATRILYKLKGFKGLGYDEVEETYDETELIGGPTWGDGTETPGAFTPHQRGQRVSTLEIRCETESQEDDLDALYYVQEVRDGMSLPGVTEILSAADCGIGTILLEPTDLTDTKNMRRTSVAQMDVSINAAANTDGAPYGQIATAEITFEGRDSADDVVPRFSVTVDWEIET